MSTTVTPSTEIVVFDRSFADPERLALAGFLAGYSGQTRDAYTMDLRLFATWCAERDIRLFEVRRADIECYARQLEDRGRTRSTIARRLSTVVGFLGMSSRNGPTVMA